MTESEYMADARECAAQCWCDDTTKDIEMDVNLAEAVAKRIALWMDTAATNQRNSEYYRGLLEQCGRFVGDEAYIADDGSYSEDVLCVKIPEIVEKILKDHVNVNTTTYKLDRDKLPEMTKEQKERMQNLTESDINKAAQSDPDAL